jgi:hypothetical protein
VEGIWVEANMKLVQEQQSFIYIPPTAEFRNSYFIKSYTNSPLLLVSLQGKGEQVDNKNKYIDHGDAVVPDIE